MAMKTIITLLLVALVGVFGQQWLDTVDQFGQVASWTGDLNLSTTQFYGPNGLTPTCTRRTTLTNFYAFNQTFTTDGTRQVGVMAVGSFKANFQVFLYTAFDVDQACNGLVRLTPLTNGNYAGDSGVMLVNDPVFFQQNVVYTFVVTSKTAGIYGQFALSIFGSTAVGTTVGQPTWIPSNAIATGCSVGTLAPQQLNTYSWTATATGNFDVLVMFENTGMTANEITNNSVNYAIYKGNVDAATLSANSCPTSPAIDISGGEGDLMTVLLSHPFTQDNPYTIAVSNNKPGRFAIQILPSRVIQRSAGTFAQPSRGTPPSCTTNSSASAAGYVLSPVITATYPTHFFDTYGTHSYDLVQSFPEESFGYQGSITQSATIASCPTGTTLLASVNTGAVATLTSEASVSNGPMVLSTTAGSQYTVVISTLDGSNLQTPPPVTTDFWGSQLFVLAGNSLNPAGTSTTSTSAAGSTGTTTSGTPGTSGTTGTAGTTTTTGNTGTSSNTTDASSTTGSTATSSTGATGATATGSSTTSGATTISISALLVLAAFFIAC